MNEVSPSSSDPETHPLCDPPFEPATSAQLSSPPATAPSAPSPQPAGPYRVFGHSFGALIAHQVALMFEANGETVAALVLGDFEVTYPPSRSRAEHAAEAGRFGLEGWEGGEVES